MCSGQVKLVHVNKGDVHEIQRTLVHDSTYLTIMRIYSSHKNVRWYLAFKKNERFKNNVGKWDSLCHEYAKYGIISRKYEKGGFILWNFGNIGNFEEIIRQLGKYFDVFFGKFCGNYMKFLKKFLKQFLRILE